MATVSCTDKKLVLATARTICQAFSKDPLICWLRPGAIPWAQLDKNALQWQSRRVEWATINGRVLGIWHGHEEENSFETHKPASLNISTTNIIPLADAFETEDVSMDAVAMLFPSNTPLAHRLRTCVHRFWLVLLDWLRPVTDPGGEPRRVHMMFESHEQQHRALRQRFGKRLWYIEVIAVNPEQQGRGFGSKIMKAALQRTKDDPVYLECTDKSNVSFYEKFGFQTVNEAVLGDGDDITKSWVMVRAANPLE